MSDTRNTRATAKYRFKSSKQRQRQQNAYGGNSSAKSGHDNKKALESIVKNVFDKKTRVLQETRNENARTLQELHLKMDRQNKTVEKLEEKVLKEYRTYS